MRYVFLIFLFVFNFKVLASEFGKCDVFFPNNRPPEISNEIKKTSVPLCYNDFAILYSIKTKTPVYTVERLSYLNRFHKEPRTNNFHEELRLKPKDRSTLDDYKNSGYDRGHNVPAADCKNPICMTESFSLSNMSPQSKKLNRVVLAKSVEMATRKYVERASGDVFVFTGGHYEGNDIKTIGKNKVAVPTHVWKLVFDSEKKKSWVFWLENTETVKMTPPISYEEFVKKTGLNLLD